MKVIMVDGSKELHKFASHQKLRCMRMTFRRNRTHIVVYHSNWDINRMLQEIWKSLKTHPKHFLFHRLLK